jgi:hypothetical protein
MVKYLLVGLLLLLVPCSNTSATGIDAKRFYESRNANRQEPLIDGVLNDQLWLSGVWQGNFTQREPLAGAPPHQKTEFQIAYDNNYLYVAIKAYDTSPDSISVRVTRRDEIEGDRVGLAIDSYFDKKTAFGFWVSAAGVKNDFIITDDGESEDSNWDPIWWAKTSRSEDAWCAEMKIPLNQLRFANEDNLTWGLQVGRYLFRKQESSYWQYIPKDAPGWVHKFGEMNGIRGLSPKRQVEIAPYMVAKTESYLPSTENPFLTGKRNGLNAGVDAKIGLSNNLILDLTVNPDFGQVEADPSVVNLSAFETYFEEKRPFFVEGRNLYSYNLVGGDGDQAAENLFYSRRIGRSPQLSPDLNDKEYADIPTNTTILGAAKISGRNKNGLSVGIMESLTASSYAKIDSLGKRRNEMVEPLTNYFVGSLRREFSSGNTIVSGIFTSTSRQLTPISEDFLHRNAFTGGLNIERFWKNKNYMFSTKVYFSHVVGTEDAIRRTQESSARYFQRPDIGYVHVDTLRTSLTGSGGLIQFAKSGQGHLRYMAFVSWKSPQLEVNDLGYSSNVDDIFQVAWVGIRFWKPFFIFRNLNINLNQWTGWNFGGMSTYKGGNINLNFQLKNYWNLSTGINRNGQQLSASALWGGPMLKLPGNWNNWFNVSSDRRNQFVFSVGGSNNWGDEGYQVNHSIYANFSYRPSRSLQLTVSPEYYTTKRKLQYVSTPERTGDPRYIVASLNQKTYEISVRVEYSLNPDLTVQYYGRPYLSNGEYFDYKRITDPRAERFADRYSAFTTQQLTYNSSNEEYSADENLDGVVDYVFPRKGYCFLSFQSNMIVRWEYRPGSTLFFVWTMGKNDYDNGFSRSVGSDLTDLFDSHPHSTFLLKFSYRFN